MTTESIRALKWKQLYQVALMEPDRTKLAPLLSDAINAVLDQIEETVIHGELEELNTALNRLRSRRKEVNGWKVARTDISDRSDAA